MCRPGNRYLSRGETSRDSKFWQTNFERIHKADSEPRTVTLKLQYQSGNLTPSSGTILAGKPCSSFHPFFSAHAKQRTSLTPARRPSISPRMSAKVLPTRLKSSTTSSQIRSTSPTTSKSMAPRTPPLHLPRHPPAPCPHPRRADLRQAPDPPPQAHQARPACRQAHRTAQ